jgi:hypothetical protein
MPADEVTNEKPYLRASPLPSPLPSSSLYPTGSGARSASRNSKGSDYIGGYAHLTTRPNGNGNGSGNGGSNRNSAGSAIGTISEASRSGTKNGHATNSTNGNGNGNGNNLNGNSTSKFTEKVASTGNGNASDDDNSNQVPPKPLYAQRSIPATPRRSQPTSILGAIDEDGGMSPDIPLKSPRRRSPPSAPPSYRSRTFFNALLPAYISPPKNDLDDVEGPHGEKFSDVRKNRRADPVAENWKRRMVRNMVCIGILLVIMAALVAIGVVIGLKRKKGGG